MRNLREASTQARSTSTWANIYWPRVGIIFGFLIGLTVTLERNHLVPVHYTYDSQKIQAIAQGTISAGGDYTFGNVAAVYRFLGLQNAADAVAVGGYLLATAVILLAIWRAGQRVGGPLEFALIVASFLLSGVYLGNYSKEIFVVLVVAVVFLAPRHVLGDAAIAMAICAYALLFRQYWLLIGIAFILFRVFTRYRFVGKYIAVFGAIGAVAVGFGFYLAMGLSPDHFRTIVNDTRSVEANTAIIQFVNLPQPWGGIINVVLCYLALIVPLQLLWTAGPNYAPVVAIFAFVWLTVIFRLWRAGDWSRSKQGEAVLVRRAVSLAFAFLLTQSLFEPDYGSALRHLTPILPLVIVVFFLLRGRSLSDNREVEHSGSRVGHQSVKSDDTILVMHWGQNGGGPRFAVRMARAISETWSGTVLTSFNRNAEALRLDGLQSENDFPVTTYHNVAGLVLGLPRLALIGLRLRRFVKRNDVRVVFSAMLSIWQSLAISVFLPKNVMFVASIHDAVEHPGDAHWALRLCRRLDCTRADRIVVYSESARDILHTQLGTSETPIFVVPLGADAPIVNARTLKATAGRAVTLGFVGRIVEYKGLDLFVELVQGLSAVGLNIRGVVVGSGKVAPKLIESSSDVIDWQVGWIPESRMAEVFDGIDVLVLPYREASQSAVYSLALSAGVPSVSTPVGGLEAQVNSTGGGIVASEVSAASLAEAVRKVLVAESYDALSKRCLEAAAGSVSWTRSASVLLENIQSQPISAEGAPSVVA